ncbi:RNA recognition motif domain-containing protein [Streptomyces sp. NPDC102462]|uniref:RNA recognition motif domain-containing protein n=1 Tax=Streptomyces sp. NPDC102462 TaxID=3366178 RepID=UPI00380F4FAF
MDVTDEGLRRAFEEFGQVVEAAVERDAATGYSRRFGFVEMSTPAEASAAVDALHRRDLDGRTLTVNEVRTRSGRCSKGIPNVGPTLSPIVQR